MSFELSTAPLSPAHRKILAPVDDLIEATEAKGSISLFRVHYRDLQRLIPQSHRQYYGTDMTYKGVKLVEGYK